MENKKIPSNKKLISIQEEKLLRQVDYDSIPESSSRPPKKLFLEIIQKGSNSNHPSQKVLVSIKPKSPAIKTIFLAEKNRFQSKKNFEKAGSRLALGDYSSFTTHFSDNNSNTLDTRSVKYVYKHRAQSEIITSKDSKCSTLELTITDTLRSTDFTSLSEEIYNTKDNQSYAERCYIYTQPQFTMTNTNSPRTIKNKHYNSPKKVDIGTFIVTNSSTEIATDSCDNLKNINKRIAYLEKKVLRQEMVFRSMSPKIGLSSSEEDSKDFSKKKVPKTDRPGCSYVEYSHIPKTSAFQRYTRQLAPLSASKATTIEKEHNSEQYGRAFTLYDGITSRGRRQCASVPCKRDEGQKLASDRVHRIRHKLNPVRDYRLMDTVHYLAQGEFAPRDDGIKLTPSREAVLSDIIWEDVCRTHWPNTRLARRIAHPERCGPKSELQRLIDNLLRERIAHVERRRRRHYRIVKLNHRHENCRPIGKTGDIIVASHKNRSKDEANAIAVNECASKNMSMLGTSSCNKQYKNYDHLKETRQNKQLREEDCAPGPSNTARHSIVNRETCCYHSSNPGKHTKASEQVTNGQKENKIEDLTSDSFITNKINQNNPRLIVKKNSLRKKRNNDEPNLEQFILLPTLVVKTPSNMKRQKKFNELYHRILNVQLKKAKGNSIKSYTEYYNSNKTESGLNLDGTSSNSEGSLIENEN